MLLAVVALVRFCSAGNWMDGWLRREDGEKGVGYDFVVTWDFIKNSGGECSSVFSPMCCGMNVLLQGCAGEYGEDAKVQAMRDLEKAAEMADGMDRRSLNVLSRVYVPEDGTLALPETQGDIFRTYVPCDDMKCGELLVRHGKWAWDESSGRLQSLLRIEDFMRKSRVYASLAYFEDLWYYQFDPKKTEPGDFYLGENETTSREFMEVERYFLHYEHACDRAECSFDLVAVPYVGVMSGGSRYDFARYAIYLVPKETGGDLKGVWEEFSRISGYNVENLLGRCSQEKKITLRVPKIERLRSELDLKKILRDTYGDGPGPRVESTIAAYINVDEHGTEAAAIVETVCHRMSDSPENKTVNANRRHILLVYDRTLNRILFAVKDVGGSGPRNKSREKPAAERESSESLETSATSDYLESEEELEREPANASGPAPKKALGKSKSVWKDLSELGRGLEDAPKGGPSHSEGIEYS